MLKCCGSIEASGAAVRCGRRASISSNPRLSVYAYVFFPQHLVLTPPPPLPSSQTQIVFERSADGHSSASSSIPRVKPIDSLTRVDPIKVRPPIADDIDTSSEDPGQRLARRKAAVKPTDKPSNLPAVKPIDKPSSDEPINAPPSNELIDTDSSEEEEED